jgi:glycolate oxidase FAD binding subunit
VQLAAVLAAAATAGRATVISGGGTKIDWGRHPARIDLIVGTSRLNEVTHRDGDLTATVGAGATLTEVNRELARRGQWLPLDSAFDAATVGGTIASNDAGPLRHRFGTPRDRLLGVTLAMTDGRLVKAGGTVVKNVAGYDLARLVSGSFGTLAAIETATFKLAPLPAASATLKARFTDHAALCRTAHALHDSPLELTALDIHVAFGHQQSPVYHLLLRIASSPAATAAQLSAAQSILGVASEVLRDAAEVEVWSHQLRAAWEGTGATVRLSWRPADLVQVLPYVEEMQRRIAVPVVLTGRVGVGAGLVRIDGTAPVQPTAIETLRASPLLGHVVVLRADRSVKDQVDVWGPIGDSGRVMEAIKRKLDPAAILNAGRGPI